MCVCAYPQHSTWALRSQVCYVFKQFNGPLFPASKIFPQALVKAKRLFFPCWSAQSFLLLHVYLQLVKILIIFKFSTPSGQEGFNL